MPVIHSMARKRGRTSTAEILGVSSPRTAQLRWREHYQRLTTLREQFLEGKSAQTESAKDELSSFSEHMADAATDSYDRDCALALLSSAQNALYEIEQALQRIADGSYGICELSGDPIETERLRAIPWTRYSLAAQAQLEARGAVGRVQLGRLGSCVRGTDATEATDTEEESEEAPPARRRRESSPD